MTVVLPIDAIPNGSFNPPQPSKFELDALGPIESQKLLSGLAKKTQKAFWADEILDSYLKMAALYGNSGDLDDFYHRHPEWLPEDNKKKDKDVEIDFEKMAIAIFPRSESVAQKTWHSLEESVSLALTKLANFNMAAGDLAKRVGASIVEFVQNPEAAINKELEALGNAANEILQTGGTTGQMQQAFALVKRHDTNHGLGGPQPKKLHN